MKAGGEGNTCLTINAINGSGLKGRDSRPCRGLGDSKIVSGGWAGKHDLAHVLQRLA